MDRHLCLNPQSSDQKRFLFAKNFTKKEENAIMTFMEPISIDLASYEDKFQAVIKDSISSPGNNTSHSSLEKSPPLPVGKLGDAEYYSTPDEDQLITYLTTCYWLNGGYPGFQELLETCSYSDSYLRQLITRMSDRLENRGLPKYVLPPGPEDRIFVGWTQPYDPRFVMAVNIVTNVTDKRTKAAKLNEVGVSMAEWDGWLTNNENYQFYQRMVEIKWGQLDETAKLQIMNNVEKGDLQAIKYFHEFTGKFTPTAQVQVNMGLVIARVIETLTRFVEPAKLEEIASALTSERIFETSAEEVMAPWEQL